MGKFAQVIVTGKRDTGASEAPAGCGQDRAPVIRSGFGLIGPAGTNIERFCLCRNRG